MVEHPVLVRGLTVRGVGVGHAPEGPTVLQRTDQEFLPAILGELAGEDDGTTGADGESADLQATIRHLRRDDRGVEAVARSVATTRNTRGVLKLFQPVHGTFHVALVEVACDIFGAPPLAPDRIDSAGLVLRRVAGDDRDRAVVPEERERWAQAGTALRGWVRFASGREEAADPDPQQRPPPLAAGHPEIDRRLAARQPLTETLAETYSTLFVAPPAVCEAAGRTILYGLVPVTSDEISESPAALPEFDLSNVSLHLHPLLRRGGGAPAPSWAGRTLTAADADGADRDVNELVLMLRQLVLELDAFGTTAEARALHADLNRITLTFSRDPLRTRPAGDFLRDATRVLVEREEGAPGAPAPTVTMPLAWPALDDVQGARLLDSVKAAMMLRLPLVKPREGRFDDPRREYRLRAFVRVKRPDGCPPAIVWSGYSAPFTIAPWYESGNAPPVPIPLPDPFDREFLRNLKPNVAFVVPENLLGLLNRNTPKQFLDGAATGGGGAGGLDWICAFSIPIITLCAFIVLNIFLQLFDLVFRWLLFVKICIPVPRR